MKKNLMFCSALIFSLFVLPVAVLPGSDLVWAEEKALVPMELNDTEWDVTMVHMTKKGKKESKDDRLIFSDEKFISEEFEKKGYDPTNYSLTLQEDGTTRFGTMQVKGKEVSFWKGILKKDGVIDGSVHTQFSGGSSTRTTYFTGKLAKGELWRKGEKPEPEPEPEPDPEPLPLEEAAPEAPADEIEVE